MLNTNNKSIFFIMLTVFVTLILFLLVKSNINYFYSDDYHHSMDLNYSPGFLAIEKKKWNIALYNNLNLSGWQDEIRKKILESLDIQTLNVDHVKYRIIKSEIVNKEIKRSLIIFTTFDGAEIPAYIHTPITTKLTPLILVLPGHVKDGQSGIEQTSQEIDSYHHALAMQLALHGFTTLTFELRGFGYLGKPNYPDHKVVAYNALLAGTSYKSIIFQDIIYAKNILLNQKNSDINRLGITGVSFGGELSLQYAALDNDIKVVVSQSSGTHIGYKKYFDQPLSKQPHYCHFIPGVDLNIKWEEWFWLIAPRPLLITRGTNESNNYKKSFSSYQFAWKITGAIDKFKYLLGEGGHEYYIEPSLKHFNQYLSNQIKR